MKRCPGCSKMLVNLYCRDGASGLRWVKISEKYCKRCRKIFQRKHNQ